MTDFGDFVSDAFDHASDVFGRVTGSIDAIPLSGILDQIKLDRSLAMGGETASVPATFMCGADQLTPFPKPWERTLEGKHLIIGSQDYRILAVAIDDSCVTLTLDDGAR